MSSNIALILASTLLSLQTNLAIAQGLERTAIMIDPMPMTAEQRVEKGKRYFEEGVKYRYGVNQLQNRALGNQYFRESAELGNADAMIFLAVELFDEGDIPKSEEYTIAALKAGNEVANYMLGYLTEENNEEQARYYNEKGFNALKEKVEQGDLHYANLLGYAYRYGIGTEENTALAIQAFKKAAEQGNSVAMGHLSEIYLEQGKREQAQPLMLASAEKNNPTAQYNLATYFFEPGSKGYFYWMEKADENGNLEATRDLAEYYRDTDPKKTRYYYQKGSEMNDPDSLLALSEMYEYGEGGKADQQKALALLKRAAETGNTDAMTELVKRYLTGTGGVEKDEEQAAYWFKKLGFDGEGAFDGLKDVLEKSLKRVK
ncbi:sel1 repeat family protein [Aggregatibacter actinomycetemcomitans]|nr:sel1 repeat family protein [Aggregatibacter actinomycetemcomitans]